MKNYHSDLKNCPFCGQLISDEFNFCPYCAAKIDKVKVGGRYGRLTVVRKTSQKPRYGSGPVYECKCDCGNIAFVESKFLMSGNTTSCGCRLAEINQDAIKWRKNKEDEFWGDLR